MTDIRIAELAERLGVTKRTLRYYEEIGLISPDRSVANNRLYSAATQERARLVSRLRWADISMDEIAAALSPHAATCRAVEIGRELDRRLDSLEVERRHIRSLLGRMEKTARADDSREFMARPSARTQMSIEA